MKETIEHLIQLQRVDTKIYDMENAKGDLPERVKRLRDDLEYLNQSINEKMKQIEKAQIECRLSEGELKLSEEKLKKHQNQLYDVTTNKEYDAITQEIEQEKQNINACETRVLELISFEEETAKEAEKQKENTFQVQKDLKENDDELKKLEMDIESEELKLMHEREKILVRLNKPLLNQYKRILKAKNNLAVVPITRNACGGCFNTIPPQTILEIRKMERIYNCEVCGRILVWQENGNVPY